MRPDYRLLLHAARTLGRERLRPHAEKLLSSLANRRASDVFEFWSVFALHGALLQLGWTTSTSSPLAIVDAGVFEADLTHSPIAFAKQGTTLQLWYERLAQPAGSKGYKKGDAFLAACAAKEERCFLSRSKAQAEPDFWIELTTNSRTIGAVGDALFSDYLSARDRAGVLEKQNKVAFYLGGLASCAPGREPILPSKPGFIILCADAEAAAEADDQCNHAIVHFGFKPPMGDEVPFGVADETLTKLEEYLAKLQRR